MKNGIKILAVLLPFSGLFGVVLLLTMMMVSDSASKPIEIVATEEQAAEYQLVGSEFGVPWDIVMLADAIDAQSKGKSGLKEYNPLISSLEFCKLLEEKYILEIETDEETGDEREKWELESRNYFSACDEILNYIGLARQNLNYTEASKIIEEIQTKTEKKTTDKEKYVATLVCNPDYTIVLETYLKMTKDNIDGLLELYEAKYLPYLYGYMQTDIGDIVLPPITVGNVSREELVRVAASLINWPYMMGGKSSAQGNPSGPLDCSGYVDWVYIQCFGKGISAGGSLPSGVAVAGTAIQYYASKAITESELTIGDLGFLYDPATLQAGKVNHVGIYIGEINGQHAFIHCAGKYYGNADRPSGRVGVSVPSGENSTIATIGGNFSPAMKSCKFKLFRRPNFQFIDNPEE